jgi:aminobenzoyl-glutamate transport protein
MNSAEPAAAPEKRRLTDRFLDTVERVGNALPDPTTLFALSALAVIVLSGIAAQFDLSVAHPTTGEVIHPVSLLSVDGLHRILTGLVTNFTSFAPLGTVLVALIGIGVAEASGLIGAVMRLLVLKSPRALLTPVVVFCGVLSNAASEVGYVLLVPLAALIFKAAGRHPVLGLAAAFAGVSGGYSANFVLGTIDPLLAGLSQEAARIIDPSYTVSPASNYYFMFMSTFLITGLGWWVTEKLVAPRLEANGGAELDGEGGEDADEAIKPLAPGEKRGLKFAFVAFVLFTGLLLWGLLPGDGFLRDPVTGGVLHSPFLKGIVAIIFFFGVGLGVAYGIGRDQGHEPADVHPGRLHGPGVLRRPVRGFFQLDQPGPDLRRRGRAGAQGRRPAPGAPAAELHPAVGGDQPGDGLSLGQVGADGAGVHPDVHAAWLSAGADPDRLSGG